MHELLKSFRWAARRLLHTPSLLFTGSTTIALSIGAAGAVFSIVYCVLVRPLPYKDPGRLVMVWRDLRSTGRKEPEWLSFPDYADWQERNRTFEGIAAVDEWQPTWNSGAEPEQIRAGAVSHSFFKLLGVQPALGRDLTAEDDRPGAPPVIVVSNTFWRDRLGADPHVLGTALQLAGESWTIVGVLPAGFRAPFGEPQLWRALRRDRASDLCGRGCIYLHAVGRLKPGVSLAIAQQELSTILTDVGKIDRDVIPGSKAWLIPLQRQMTSDVRLALLVLAGAVLMVLLLACANVSNLLLMRATRSVGESAIKIALGSGRWRVALEMMLDGILLAGFGGLLGAWLAVTLTGFLRGFIPPALANVQTIEMNGRMVALTVALALMTGAIAGVAPALIVTRLNLGNLLRDARQAGRSRAANRVRSTLAMLQFTFCFVLLFAAALFVRAFLQLSATQLGFDPRRVAYASLTIPRDVYSTASAETMLRSLTDAVRAIPGVESVGMVTIPPLSDGDMVYSFQIVGKPRPEIGRAPTGWYRRITPDYLTVMRRKVVRGRTLEAGDGLNSPRVALISESGARAYWPGENAVGQRIMIGGPDGDATTIVGVLADARHDGPDQPMKPELFVPYAQDPAPRYTIVARAATGQVVPPAALRRAIRAANPNVVVSVSASLEEKFEGALALPRLYMWLFAFFGVASIVLAAIGLYGIMAHHVASHARELAIRAAMGADPQVIAKGVLRDAAPIVGFGSALGLATAMAAARVVGSVFVPLPPASLLLLAAVAMLMLAIGLLGAFRPALAAARTDPTTALRAG